MNYPVNPAEIQRYKIGRKRISDLLLSYEDVIAETLPKHVSAAGFNKAVLNNICSSLDLMQCSPASIIGAVMTAAELGLIPGDVLGECYFKAENNGRSFECLFIPGYRGLCALAMRSGQVYSIKARAVYEGDDFKYSLGLDEALEYVDNGGNDTAKITHFFCIIRFMNGGRTFDVYTRAKMEAIRNEIEEYKNAADKSQTIWGKHFKAQGCKTITKELLKLVPMSAEINRAIGLDDRADFGLLQNVAADYYDDIKEKEYLDQTVTEIIVSDKSKKAAKNQNKTEVAKKRGVKGLDAVLSKLKK